MKELKDFTSKDSNFINKKSCNTCQNLSCKVESNEKNGIDENGYAMGTFCVGYINVSAKQEGSRREAI